MARKPLSRLEKKVLKSMKEANKESAKLLEQQIRENASLTDHKLDALEKLGHPYAVRNPQPIHKPDFQVHRQSGNLIDAVAVVAEGAERILVGVDDTKVPYVRHVIRGTKFMVARDFITGSFNEIAEQITSIFAKKLKQAEDQSTDNTTTDLRR